MKNLLVFVFALCISIGVRGQQVDIGMSFIPAASTTNFAMSKMTVSTSLLAHVNFSTHTRYHTLAYDFEKMALAMFHGWVYKKDQDVYVFISKNLKDREGYLALGWEHTISNGGFSPSGFIEIGTNYAFSESYLSIGIFAPLNYTVWKKK